MPCPGCSENCLQCESVLIPRRYYRPPSPFLGDVTPTHIRAVEYRESIEGKRRPMPMPVIWGSS
jgi:hypothetical protein